MHKVFMDTETSGLDCDKNQILTIALVICDEKGKEVYGEEHKVIQQPWAEIVYNALKVNGINLEEHNKTALSEKEVCEKIVSTLNMYGLNRPIPVGQNVTFDIGFIKKMFERNNMRYPFNYHFQDTMVLANALRDVGKMHIANVKLGTIASFFGLTTEFHRALEDTRMTAQVYYKMLELINPPLPEIEELNEDSFTKSFRVLEEGDVDFFCETYFIDSERELIKQLVVGKKAYLGMSYKDNEEGDLMIVIRGQKLEGIQDE